MQQEPITRDDLLFVFQEMIDVISDKEDAQGHVFCGGDFPLARLNVCIHLLIHPKFNVKWIFWPKSKYYYEALKFKIETPVHSSDMIIRNNPTAEDILRCFISNILFEIELYYQFMIEKMMSHAY